MAQLLNHDDGAIANCCTPATGVRATTLNLGGTFFRVYYLTHRFSIHTPGWVGYPSPKLSYFQRRATHGVVLHCFLNSPQPQR